MAAQRSKRAKGKQPPSDALRRLPAVERLLEDEQVVAWIGASGYPREFAARAVGRFLDRIRARVLEDGLDVAGVEAALAGAAAGVALAADELTEPHLRHVVNATGVVVHTNLGRSPWPAAAAARAAQLARRYVNLELDLETGGRGQRGVALQRLVGTLLPGAAAAVVNNNAAAVLLVLNTLAEDKEVVVSRGQLVEIGGSFRIPDVMRKSRSVLREVGTTNRTRIGDFEAALSDRTGAILSVHPSNYRVVGFTEETGLAELVGLGAATGVPVVEDLGSGCLIDLAGAGIGDEPTIAARLETGVDLVTFSGDKLLGGPQAGFIVGKPEFVARVRANPLYRALRLDKATTLALEATLAVYVSGNLDEIPALRMLHSPASEVRARALALADRIASVGVQTPIEVIEIASQAGGGAAPGQDLPSFGLALAYESGPDALMKALRGGEPPVIGRIVDDRVVLDVRTVLPDEDELLVGAVAGVLG